VDKFPEITGQIQRSGTGIGEDISGILVGDTFRLITVIPISDLFHSVTHFYRVDGVRGNILETILGTISLAPLGKGTMPVSHQLVGTGPGDTFDLEGEVDVFQHTMMSVTVEVLHQTHRVGWVAVVADGCNLCNGLHRVRGGLNQGDLHSHYSSVK
jgi:hypothetical protein